MLCLSPLCCSDHRAAAERLTGIAWHPNARPQIHLKQQQQQGDATSNSSSSSSTVALGTGCADGTAALWSEGGSLLRKLGTQDEGITPDYRSLTLPVEQACIAALLAFPKEIREAAQELKPNLLTRATFEVAKAFAGFFNSGEARVIGAEPAVMAARANLVRAVRRTLRAGLELMGATALEEM